MNFNDLDDAWAVLNDKRLPYKQILYNLRWVL